MEGTPGYVSSTSPPLRSKAFALCWVSRFCCSITWDENKQARQQQQQPIDQQQRHTGAVRAWKIPLLFRLSLHSRNGRWKRGRAIIFIALSASVLTYGWVMLACTRLLHSLWLQANMHMRLYILLLCCSNCLIRDYFNTETGIQYIIAIYIACLNIECKYNSCD